MFGGRGGNRQGPGVGGMAGGGRQEGEEAEVEKLGECVRVQSMGLRVAKVVLRNESADALLLVPVSSLSLIVQVCCSVLQRVAVCVAFCVAWFETSLLTRCCTCPRLLLVARRAGVLQRVATCCSVLHFVLRGSK